MRSFQSLIEKIINPMPELIGLVNNKEQTFPLEFWPSGGQTAQPLETGPTAILIVKYRNAGNTSLEGTINISPSSKTAAVIFRQDVDQSLFEKTSCH